jgi:hypothetical protein
VASFGSVQTTEHPKHNLAGLRFTSTHGASQLRALVKHSYIMFKQCLLTSWTIFIIVFQRTKLYCRKIQKYMGHMLIAHIRTCTIKLYS